MRHFDPPMGSISALMLKKKSGIGTRVSQKDESCWSRLLCCSSASIFDCISEESAICCTKCLKVHFQSVKVMCRACFGYGLSPWK